ARAPLDKQPRRAAGVKPPADFPPRLPVGRSNGPAAGREPERMSGEHHARLPALAGEAVSAAWHVCASASFGSTILDGVAKPRPEYLPAGLREVISVPQMEPASF